jgi:hypothetical protein
MVTRGRHVSAGYRVVGPLQQHGCLDCGVIVWDREQHERACCGQKLAEHEQAGRDEAWVQAQDDPDPDPHLDRDDDQDGPLVESTPDLAEYRDRDDVGTGETD